MAEIDWTVFGPIAAKMLADLLAAERSRTGLTDAQIFERAGKKLDDNNEKLLADILRLQGAQP